MYLYSPTLNHQQTLVERIYRRHRCYCHLHHCHRRRFRRRRHHHPFIMYVVVLSGLLSSLELVFIITDSKISFAVTWLFNDL